MYFSKKLLLPLFIPLLSLLHAGDVVMMDEPYYKKDFQNIELLYTKQNLPFAEHTVAVEKRLQPFYEKMFGYKMDENLSIVLASEKNQIPNAFATQYPNNRQINYMGGSLLPNYFTSSSWLDTLLYHETAHNYQMNEKDNIVSSTLHSIFANGAFFIPWFTIPNIAEGSFMAEGNALLNESLHGIGGRLYSGRFKIETLMQAKAGKLTPQLLYNDNFHFLYGLHFYVLGGAYHYYLAQKYGIKRVNSYWKYHSHHWLWPFLTNSSMKESMGVDFEQSIHEWALQMQKEAQKVTQAKGKTLLSSQFFSEMNDDDKNIYFIINETARERPKLVVYNKKSGQFTKKPESFLQGKVIYREGKYTTQASNFINPWNISIGLFDKNGEITPQSQSKVIEGYMSDGKAIYFDVPSSYKSPQLYIGKEFYQQVNSSVFISHDTLYYFKQQGKKRTLYKNKKPLTSVQGYYGHVVGVNSRGGVYFIANSHYGSSLFCYENGTIVQVSPADTIIDARLIDDKNAIVATVGSDAYNFKKITLSKEKKTPYNVKLFHKEPKAKPVITPAKLTLQRKFIPLFDMHYSATNLSFGVDNNNGFFYNFNLNFEDALTLNTLTLFSMRAIDGYTFAGATYANTQYFINFMLSSYAIVAKPENRSKGERDYGLFSSASLPFLHHGFWSGVGSLSYYEDYQADGRQPLSALLSLKNEQKFGVSLYPNSLLEGKIYYSHERDNALYGGGLEIGKDFGNEFYTTMGLQYSQSQIVNPFQSKGVEVVQTILDSLEIVNPSSIVMPSLNTTLYLKDATKATLEMKKVFNADAYFFTFPLSLRRESLLCSYSHYAFHGRGTSYAGVNEYSVGVLFDTYLMNLLPLPITVEYLHSDNEMLSEKESVRISTGVTF